MERAAVLAQADDASLCATLDSVLAAVAADLVTVYLSDEQPCTCACVSRVHALRGVPDPRRHAVRSAEEARSGGLLVIDAGMRLGHGFSQRADELLVFMGHPPFLVNLDGDMHAVLLRGADMLEDLADFMDAWAAPDPFVRYAANRSVGIRLAPGAAAGADPAFIAASGACPSSQSDLGLAVFCVCLAAFAWLTWAAFLRALLRPQRCKAKA
jgi:hypothetical protein